MADKDETTKTGQDKLQEAGRSSGSKGGSTSKEKVTLSKSEHQKLLEDAAASRGRAEKLSSIEREKDILKDRLESTNSRLDNLERETNESRLAEARAGGNDTLLLYNREEAVKKQERQNQETVRDITRLQGQVKADRVEVDKDRGVVSVAYIAAKHGLEVERLENLGITDPEILEKVAEEMKPTAAKGEGDKGAEGDKGDESLKLDTGEGSGSGEKTDQERLDERYPTMASK